jgi:hypothetical protein
VSPPPAGADVHRKLIRIAAELARGEYLTLPDERPPPRVWHVERERQRAMLLDLSVVIAALARRVEP